MTPEEARVIEAARLFIRAAAAQHPDSPEAYDALASAVDALPVPLAERLPGLRPGAVVRMRNDNCFVVLANDPLTKSIWVSGRNGGPNGTWAYCEVTSIVSEAPDA